MSKQTFGCLIGKATGYGVDERLDKISTNELKNGPRVLVEEQGTFRNRERYRVYVFSGTTIDPDGGTGGLGLAFGHVFDYLRTIVGMPFGVGTTQIEVKYQQFGVKGAWIDVLADRAGLPECP